MQKQYLNILKGTEQVVVAAGGMNSDIHIANSDDKPKKAQLLTLPIQNNGW